MQGEVVSVEPFSLPIADALTLIQGSALFFGADVLSGETTPDGTYWVWVVMDKTGRTSFTITPPNQSRYGGRVAPGGGYRYVLATRVTWVARSRSGTFTEDYNPFPYHKFLSRPKVPTQSKVYDRTISHPPSVRTPIDNEFFSHHRRPAQGITEFTARPGYNALDFIVKCTPISDQSFPSWYTTCLLYTSDAADE